MVTACVQQSVEYLLRAHTASAVDSVVSLSPGSAAIVYHASVKDTATRSALLEWASHSSQVRLLLANNQLPSAAQCWNTLLAEAKTSLPELGFLLTLDLRCRLMAPAQYAERLAMLASRDDVHAIAANNPGPYFDLPGLRSEVPYSEQPSNKTDLQLGYDCTTGWRSNWFRPAPRFARKVFTHGPCRAFRIVLHRDAPLIEATAAFNGAAIYKAGALQGQKRGLCRYYEKDSKDQFPPHVPFQECLRGANVNLFIDPALVSWCDAWRPPIPSYRFYVHPNGTVGVYNEPPEEARQLRAHDSDIAWQGLKAEWCVSSDADPRLNFEFPSTASPCCDSDVGTGSELREGIGGKIACLERASATMPAKPGVASFMVAGTSAVPRTFRSAALDVHRGEYSEQAVCNLSFTHIPKTGGTAIEGAGLSQGVYWGSFDPRFSRWSSRHQSHNDSLGRECEYGVSGLRRRPGCCELWHTPSKYLRQPKGRCSWDFCVIRDVNERLGSEYFHQTLIIKKGARGHGHGSNLELNPRVREIHMSALSRSEEADQWVQKKLAPLALGEDMGDDCHLIGQSNFLGSHAKALTVDQLPAGGCAHHRAPTVCGGGCNIVLRYSQLQEDFHALMAWAGAPYTSVTLQNRTYRENSSYALPLKPQAADLLQRVYRGDLDLLRRLHGKRVTAAAGIAMQHEAGQQQMPLRAKKRKAMAELQAEVEAKERHLRIQKAKLAQLQAEVEGGETSSD